MIVSSHRRDPMRIWFVIAAVTTMRVANAQNLPPSQLDSTPEVDRTPEIVAASVGGGVVVAHYVDANVILRSDGGNTATLSQKDEPAREFKACSRTTQTAAARTECESQTRMLLTRASPGDFAQATRKSFTRDTLFFFKRQTDTVGLVDTQINGKSVRLRITTPDDVLTRVRLLGSAPSGDAVILAESLREDRGTLRWRSQVSVFDAKGISRSVMDIDGSYAGLPNGDYVTLNDRGQLGLLRMSGGKLSVDWRKLDTANQALQKESNRAAALAVDKEALSPDFDFNRFARISAELDGDDERASNRPISRAAVSTNIKSYLSASWTMSAANYEQAGLTSDCRPPLDKLWERPRHLRDTVGRTLQSVPYKWGGYISVDGYLAQLGRNLLAGSVCTCKDPAKNYCVLSTATGIDCSGFVSRVWQVDRYTTASLGSITDPIGWRQMKSGDALNKPGRHVRIFLEHSTGPAEIGFRIAESSVSCGGVCERVLNAREMDGYQPRRYKHISD
jgi:cell wall-associated NlpC family hydrolase